MPHSVSETVASITITPSRVFGLDLIRCMAIILVVVCHVVLVFPFRHVVGERQANLLGYLGVELFFVLSGFLIGQIIVRDLSRSRSFKTLRIFLIRRWFRTLPNYFLFLGISYFAVGYLGTERGYAWRYLFFAQNLYFPMTPFFTVSWSLAVEEWFYLLFPLISLLLLKCIRSFNRAMVTSIVVCALVILLARLFHVLASDPSWDDGVRKVAVYRLDALVTGVAAALFKHRCSATWQTGRYVFSICGVLLFGGCLAAYFSLDLNTSIFTRVFLFSLVSGAIALWLPLFDSWKSSDGRMAVVVTHMSVWSYSLYLCHGVLVDQLSLHQPMLAELDSSALTCAVAGFLACSLISAIFVYTLYEKPATALRNRYS